MLINDDYEWMNFVYGPGGEGWRKANPDEVGLNDQPAKYTWLFNWGDNQNIHWYETFHIFMPMYYKDLMSVKPGEGYDLEKVLYDETKEKYDAYRQVKAIPNLIMSEVDAAKITELGNALNSYMGEAMAKFITGELDINSDTEWNNYIKELEKIGIQEYIEISQKAYDAMMK